MKIDICVIDRDYWTVPYIIFDFMNNMWEAETRFRLSEICPNLAILF